MKIHYYLYISLDIKKLKNSKFKIQQYIKYQFYSGGGTYLFVIIRYGKSDQVASSS